MAKGVCQFIERSTEVSKEKGNKIRALKSKKEDEKKEKKKEIKKNVPFVGNNRWSSNYDSQITNPAPYRCTMKFYK